MVIDHGTFGSMDSMAISKFKATCLATLERVRKTGRPLRVTRFGKPIAEICPPTPAAIAHNWLGARRDTGQILGDIVGPTSDLVDWEVRK
jgi:antitoxin (DNA-binding transcriptional repressor) of toxin-antitoxin stability system